MKPRLDRPYGATDGVLAKAEGGRPRAGAAAAGVFAREVAGRRALLDPIVAYLRHPGAVDRFAHPDPGGDVGVTVCLSPTPLATLTAGDPAWRRPASRWASGWWPTMTPPSG